MNSKGATTQWFVSNGNVYDAGGNMLGSQSSLREVGSSARSGIGGMMKVGDTTLDYADKIDAPVAENPAGISPSYSGGSSGSSSSGMSAAERKAINDSYSAEDVFLSALLSSLDAKEAAAKKRADDEYATKFDVLEANRNDAYLGLDNEQAKLDKQKTKSLSTLGADVRNLLDSGSNQLGMFGAGNSSAAGMLAVGAADLQNKNSGDIADEYNEQTGDIDYSRGQFDRKYKEDTKELNDWLKKSQEDIKNNFSDTRNETQRQIVNNKSAWQAALANKGVSLPGASASIKSGIDSITRRFNDITSPELSIKEMVAYKAPGVSQRDVTGNVQLTPGQATEYITGTTKKKKTDEVTV